MTSDHTKALGQKLFGKSEVQDKISKNALKIILGDIVTLYSEFRTAKGLGALFFNTTAPSNSLYMTIKEIYNDIIVAEELIDSDTKQFLQSVLNIVEKNSDNTTPIVVMVDAKGLSVHLLDLDAINDNIEKHAQDISDER
jgi:hypothetical protein|tara:strand:- start:12186 stop:12605 length:420 start_codon:yes stop_codon:yes gene_type:complete